MIISASTKFGDRHGRVFFGDQAMVPPAEKLAQFFDDTYFEQDDIARDRLLRELMRSPIVEGVIHPGVDPSDVVQVYLSPPGGAEPLFACTIVTEDRLVLMLQEAPIVSENFCLQVASGPNLTGAALTAAVESWAARNYPELAPPQFRLLPWVGEESSDALEVVLATSQATIGVEVGTQLPKRVAPNPNMPQPALPRAA